jgi:hypothetical protein
VSGHVDDEPVERAVDAMPRLAVVLPLPLTERFGSVSALPFFELAVFVVNPYVCEEAWRDPPFDCPPELGAVAEAVGVAGALAPFGVVGDRCGASHRDEVIPGGPRWLASIHRSRYRSDDRLSGVRSRRAGDNARGRVPVLLCMCRLRGETETATGRLLRFLLLRGSRLSAAAEGLSGARFARLSVCPRRA